MFRFSDALQNFINPCATQSAEYLVARNKVLSPNYNRESKDNYNYTVILKILLKDLDGLEFRKKY